MPELPEVETVARQLAPLIVGKRVKRFEIFDQRLALPNPEAAAGRVIKSVERLGKQILIRLHDPRDSARPLWLCVHLRMTGRLIWSKVPQLTKPPLRARLMLNEGFVFFKDVRRFGTMRLVDDLGCVQPEGLDPLSASFTPASLAKALSGARQEIKPWMLRQDKLPGMGNIYASESLFYARLGPRRQAGLLNSAETRRLHGAIRRVLLMGIKHGGTTFSSFQNANGETGNFQRRLAVYGRAGEQCKRCGAAIERMGQQGRGTFFCPRCQAE